MEYYKTTTKYNCGVDLHTRQMYISLMDLNGNILVHRNIRNNDFAFFLKLVEPYKDDLTVTCESCFVCFRLADACEDAGIKFVLAHAYYVKSIAANKHKNDKEDARELAECLRTNRIPPTQVSPARCQSYLLTLSLRSNSSPSYLHEAVFAVPGAAPRPVVRQVAVVVEI